jgi:hypothetical protein
VAEGTNLYFTNNRVASVIAGTTTDALTEGSTNKYYSTLFFAADLAGTTTTALAEGNNKYYTDARVGSYVSGSSTIPHIGGSAFGDLLSWTGSTWTTRATSTLALNTDNLTEASTNLFWTNTRFDNRLAATTTLPNLTTLANLATVGTITTGIWNGSAIGVAYGGTGWANIAANTLLAGNGAGALATTSIGSTLQLASATLGLNLANANWWTARQNFGVATTSGFEATSTSVYFSGFTNALLATDNSGKLTATTSVGVGYLTGILPVTNGGTGVNSFGQGWIYSSGGTGALAASTSPTVNYLVATSTTATSTFAFGVQATNINLTSSTATSTAANGINLSSGCFAVNGTCVGSGGNSSGMTLLVTLTANNSATLDDTTHITSAYDSYVITYENVVPTSQSRFIMRVTTDGGSNWQSGGEYADNIGNCYTGGYCLGGNGNQLVDTTAGYGASGWFLFTNPNSTVVKYMTGASVFRDTNGSTSAGPTSMRWNASGGTTGVVNGVRFLFTSGNISTGKIRLYGLNTSGADVAELYRVSDRAATLGDIMSFDDDFPITAKRAARGDKAPLVGIVSTKPGVLLGETIEGPDVQLPIALVGRVPTKVDMGNGPIAIGDRITISSTPGVGMKAGPLDSSVGTAIEPIDHDGTITVFIDLQQSLDINAISFGLLATSTTSTSTSVSVSEAPQHWWSPSAFLSGLFDRIALWFADTANGIGDFFANRIMGNQVCAKRSDGTYACITGDELDTVLRRGLGETAGAAASADTKSDASAALSPSPTSAADPAAEVGSEHSMSTPAAAPVISINGENPAHIHVGDAYSDLGAAITAPEEDKNLGIKTYLNGALVSDIVLDTSEPATDTIEYVVAGHSGLTSTSTRTVFIDPLEELPVSTSDSATVIPIIPPDDATLMATATNVTLQ